MSKYNSPSAAHKPAHGGYPGQIQESKVEGPLTKKYGAKHVAVLLTALIGVRSGLEDGALSTSRSLCSALGCALRSAGEDEYDFVGIRHYLYQSWPDFSGRPIYPVPGRGTDEEDEAVAEHWAVAYSDGEELDFDDGAELAAAYFNAVDDGVLHDGNYWVGAYGQKRKQLLQYMIDELIKEAIA